MHFRERFGQRQAKAGAVMVAREFFLDLFERARQARQMFGRDAAAGVNYTQCENRSARARIHHDGAGIGELDRVGEQVEQDLLDRAVIGLDLGNALGVDHDGEAFLLGLAFCQLHRLLDGHHGVERTRRQR